MSYAAYGELDRCSGDGVERKLGDPAVGVTAIHEMFLGDRLSSLKARVV
jgi:hypothetical protein